MKAVQKSSENTNTKTKTMTKTTTKTKTQKKCLKHPPYAIFLKSWWLTHSKYDDRYLTLVILFTPVTLVTLVTLFQSYIQFYRASVSPFRDFLTVPPIFSDKMKNVWNFSENSSILLAPSVHRYDIYDVWYDMIHIWYIKAMKYIRKGGVTLPKWINFRENSKGGGQFSIQKSILQCNIRP